MTTMIRYYELNSERKLAQLDNLTLGNLFVYTFKGKSERKHVVMSDGCS